MANRSGYPPSIILDGPTFSDELKYQPQSLIESHDIASLRIVPSKSAASGVHTIFFRPEHREWALVRMALRYRWVFEVQLNRGMSGERQLINQGFSPADIEFLFDIIPQPPEEYSPVVYDMLWSVATYDEYLLLTKYMLQEISFVPAKMMREIDGISPADTGFLTRFLRSHLIKRERDFSSKNRGKSGDSNISIDPGATYYVTKDGKESLRGILAEYTRIFGDGDFEPLLIDPDRDPHKHLREFDQGDDNSSPDISFEAVSDDGGVLGEIAESFSGLVEDTSSQDGDPQSASESEESTGQSDPEPFETDVEPVTHNPKRTGHAIELSSTTSSNDSGTDRDKEHETPTGTSSDDPPAPDEKATDLFFGAYSREEVLSATVAAASLIQAERIVTTSNVKAEAWEAVDPGSRNKAALWEAVSQVLNQMDGVSGRPGGRLWLSTT